MNKQYLLITALAIFGLYGCSDLGPDDNYEEFYVVESYLVAQNQLSNVLLSSTAPAFEEYNFEDVAVENAQIEVNLLEEEENSDVEQTFRYDQLEPGIYTAGDLHEVLPGRTYRLNVELPNNEGTMEAFTTVPDSFRVVEHSANDAIVYQSDEQLRITVTPSNYPGRQSIYVFNTVAQNPTVENLTPFYADQLDDEEDLSDFSNTESGLINEENFMVNEDGTITLRYPWIGVAFFEENNIIANTMDDNLYDFLRSQSVQLGGTTISPGEIQNAIYHVDGGIGVFGSFASDTVETYIQRPGD